MKTYIITGGTSGIGLASAQKILKDNKDNKVILLGRSEERVFQAEQILREYDKSRFEIFKVDITNTNAVDEFVKYLESRNENIVGLVNAAGIVKKGGIQVESYEDWKQIIDTNLNGMFYVTKSFVPFLKKEGGVIVNISSAKNLRGGDAIAYEVSKAGVDALTKSLAKELGRFKVRVNAVAPGIVKSNLYFTGGIFESDDEREMFLRRANLDYSLGVGTVEDVAEMVLFLTTEKSKWINGSIVNVDGGKLT